jgi:hypothetical protein
MRWRCSSVRRLSRLLAAAGLAACAAAAPTSEVTGRYRHAGPGLATLEVRATAGGYRVRLEGGSADALAAAAPADCIVEASGALEGAVLRARFAALETDTFSYGAAQAAEEGRAVEIRFAPDAAEVIAADTLGYCGWGADFTGRYRRVG